VSSVPIERIDVVALRVSPPPEQAALRALQGEWVFVRIHGAGLTGLGEATHSSDDAALAHLVRSELAPQLVGRVLPSVSSAAEHRDPDALVRPWFADVADRVRATAISALEQALWDLAARAAGLPLWRALAACGGNDDTGVGDVRTVPLYATLNRGIFDRSPEGFARAARQAVAEGFGAVKCAPFDGVAHGGDQPAVERAASLDTAVQRVAAVREAIGPNADLMLDCHGRLVEAEAAAIARRLERFHLRWLEEPVPFEPDPSPLARVRRAVPMPIAAGELMFGVERFRPLLEAGAVDVVMPDVKHCAGLAEGQRIARLAGEHDVAVAPHNPSGPISTLASAHLCAALTNAPLLEYAWGEVPWRASATLPAEAIVGGSLRLPGSPGLGAALDERTLAEHAHPL
jgi:galactonate dehydratase